MGAFVVVRENGETVAECMSDREAWAYVHLLARDAYVVDAETGRRVERPRTGVRRAVAQ